jgi:hypothetical protein
MTRASSLQDLYQFEKHFEDAAKTFLESATGIDVFTSASGDDFVTPRIEIQFTTGDAILPNDAPIDSFPALALGEYRKHDATFEVRVITDGTQGQTRASHFEYVGEIRVALLRSSTNWNATTLPFYGLKFIRQVSTTRETDGDFQVTTIAYQIFFSIRDNAFPTTTTTPAP